MNHLTSQQYKDFNNHKTNGIEPNRNGPKPVKVTVWQLVHRLTKQRIKHGDYALCKSFLNNYPFAHRSQYTIIPYKN